MFQGALSQPVHGEWLGELAMYETSKEAKLKEMIKRYKKEIDELEAENKRFRRRELESVDLQMILNDIGDWVNEGSERLKNLNDFIKHISDE